MFDVRCSAFNVQYCLTSPNFDAGCIYVKDRTEPQGNGQRSTKGPSAARVDSTFDLEERMLEFASTIIDVTEKLPITRAANHIGNQLLRSGTSPYGNHGEAQSAESPDDFIHKMKLCLKELRETHRWARLVDRKRWLGNDARLAFLLREGDELIRIFKASVRTAEHNRMVRSRKG